MIQQLRQSEWNRAHDPGDLHQVRVVTAMQGGSWDGHRELLALVGRAEGILLVAEADTVAAAVDSAQMGEACHLDQVYTALGVEGQYNTLDPLEGVGIHRSPVAVVVVAVVDLGGILEEVPHSTHLLPSFLLLPASVVL